MLRSTFIHIPGVGACSERKIWSSGVGCWSDFLYDCSGVPLSESRKDGISGYLKISRKRLSRGDISFFGESLPSREHWRLYSEFGDNAAFLDIETTGLGRHHDITLIGVFDGKKTHSYVLNDNLEDFEKDIGKFDLLVTFNGSCFDVPFILSKFPKLVLDQPHIDLRWVLRKIGLGGGLKSIEKELGLARSDETQDLSGWDAVRLWKRYLRGDASALETLIQYNKEDVINLKKIMEICYPRLVKDMIEQ